MNTSDDTPGNWAAAAQQTRSAQVAGVSSEVASDSTILALLRDHVIDLGIVNIECWAKTYGRNVAAIEAMVRCVRAERATEQVAA